MGEKKGGRREKRRRGRGAVLFRLSDLVDGLGVGKGGGVADLLAQCFRADDAAHDLAAAGLGDVGYEPDLIGSGELAHLLGDVVAEFFFEGLGGFDAFLEDDEAGDGLAFLFVWFADDCGLGDERV